MAKRNILKIPQSILDRIKNFDQDDVVVACAKLLKPEEVNRYAALGLIFANGKLTLPGPQVPDPKAGRYSRANVEGLEKIRKDLPKIKKEFSVEAPNWGDWSNGSHTMTWTRDVYRREFYPPKEVELAISLVEEKGGAYIIKFAVEQVINRRTPNFEQELFYNLNLLQENVGSVDVFPSAASLAEYAATVKVDWVILPPGSADEVVRKMLAGKKRVTPEQESTIKERVEQIGKLNPEAYITGSDGFLRYFGAKFGDDFVVFENVRYGNAIYVMYETWAELSKKSRIDLLNGPEESFERIPHTEGWKDKLKALVKIYRAEQKKKQV